MSEAEVMNTYQVTVTQVGTRVGKGEVQAKDYDDAELMVAEGCELEWSTWATDNDEEETVIAGPDSPAGTSLPTGDETPSNPFGGSND